MNGYASNLGQMQFCPDRTTEFTVEAYIDVSPTKRTRVRYDPQIVPGTPEFWAMTIRAGFVHYQYEQGKVPVTYSYCVRKIRKMIL